MRKAREEHRAAIEWLNNHTDDNIGFFLCEIKLFKIGSSEPAVKFEVVERPNDWAKDAKKDAPMNELSQQRYNYWSAFNDYAFQNSDFAKNFHRRKPSGDHWMDFSIGSSTYHISVLQIRRESNLSVEFYIYDDKELFNHLFQNKDAIESESGLKFDWRELPDKKASRILISKPVDFDDKEQWPEQFDWLIDTMLKMKAAFKKFL